MQQIEGKPTETTVLSELEALNVDSELKAGSRPTVGNLRPGATGKLGPLAGSMSGRGGLPRRPGRETGHLRARTLEPISERPQQSALQGMLLPGAFIMAALFVSLIAFMGVEQETLRI